MKTTDIIISGFKNLWRTKLRAILTILGVVIGIASLVSMVSFGSGLDKNISDTFLKNDLFTSLKVTSGNENTSTSKNRDSSKAVIDDRTIEMIGKTKGVILVYPEIKFRSEAGFNGSKNPVFVSVLPVMAGKYSPYNEPEAGKFFENDTMSVAMVSVNFLKTHGIALNDGKLTDKQKKSIKDRKERLLPADSIIGKELTLSVIQNNMSLLFMPGAQGIKHKAVRAKIKGILKTGSLFENFGSSDIIITPGLASRIPGNELQSGRNAEGKDTARRTYSSVYVRVDNPKDIDRVTKLLKSQGYYTFAFIDELKMIKRTFIMLSSILGAIGAIALIVASLGIINTMLMSVMERTREIGIMKAIGGAEKEIRRIFLVEAATIGFTGAVAGIIIGWLVTRVANIIINTNMKLAGQETVSLFYFPLWLVLGSIIFSVLVSIAAGMYPANRAARVNPLVALRHD